MCLLREHINTSVCVCVCVCVCDTFHRYVTVLLLDYMSSLPREQPSLLYYYYYYYYSLLGGATARGGLGLLYNTPPGLSVPCSVSFIPIFLRSVDTSSNHLIFGLPLRLVAYSFPYNIFFGIAVSCILSM